MTETPRATPDVVTGSIRLLAEQGWEATTVDRLAQAAGISRATFFRKYGSKEDIVFADHAANLERLEQLLARSGAVPGADPAVALREGVLLVFRHHLDHRERALARNALLRQVPQLRDRELITSHRYEQVLQRYLRSALPETPDRAILATALSAAAVAVHNAHLRGWLRAPETDPSAELAAQTERLARALVTGFGHPGAAPAGEPAARARPAVVVTVLDPAADTEQVLASVRDALR
ncbi:TetR family transcriptional regulator [Kocuria sediminis]|uniref:TetR family transcriptional regulator n=1 Tax=Kocuria sediminis TaxID=1038857 RepID=A0A6N8GPX3_9MICC|nr:TetR/AcrR family transcriptional regulator [Kocuria sediminis]MUN64350.1 TetR family transcriptional regulator [Kocuria sediminis]